MPSPLDTPNKIFRPKLREKLKSKIENKDAILICKQQIERPVMYAETNCRLQLLSER